MKGTGEPFEDILANTISKKIHRKIQASRRWVEKMNALMESMQTSSGLKLSLRWKNKRAEKEEQLDTRALVELLPEGCRNHADRGDRNALPAFPFQD